MDWEGSIAQAVIHRQALWPRMGGREGKGDNKRRTGPSSACSTVLLKPTVIPGGELLNDELKILPGISNDERY